MATGRIYEHPKAGDKRPLCKCGYIKGTCPKCNRAHERRMDRQAARRAAQRASK